jgi:quercetin dioxygenase-like cupin family protein
VEPVGNAYKPNHPQGGGQGRVKGKRGKLSIQSKRTERVWTPTGMAGVAICPVGGDEKVNTAAYRIEQGLALPAHTHPVWELVTVISGRLRLGDAVLSAGDFLHTDAGESHDVEAIETVEFLVTVGQDRQLG